MKNWIPVFSTALLMIVFYLQGRKDKREEEKEL